jgi:hypothetical protein
MAEGNKMNIMQIRDLALKVLGIYYLSQSIIYILQLTMVFASYGEMVEHKFAIYLPTLFCLVFWAIIGCALTFRTSFVVAILWSRQPEEEHTTTKPSLRLWIVLIGLFFFVKSLGGTIYQLLIFATRQQERDIFVYYQSLPGIITFVLSIVCIVKARAIERFLMGKIGINSQQTPEGSSSTSTEARPETTQD